MQRSTLAARLGTTTHLSPLLHKARTLGLDADGLEQLARQRGCDYYHDGSPLPTSRISLEQFSNVELALALLNPALRYHPHTLRLGAAMLSAENNTPDEIAYLTQLERCEVMVSYIAKCGRKFEPENTFWISLLERLPPVPMPESSVVPHPTRFVAMTGITRRGVEIVVEWIRPSAHRADYG